MSDSIKFRKFVTIYGKPFYVVGEIPVVESTMEMKDYAYMKIYTWWHNLVYYKDLRVHKHDSLIGETAKDFLDLTREAVNDYSATLSAAEKNKNKYRLWRKRLRNWWGETDD